MKSFVKNLFIALSLIAMLSSCYTLEHEVGNGPQGGAKTQESAWFILFGLVPLNEVDSKAMAQGADDYKVTTEFAPLDVLINIFTGIVTITRQTVSVEK